MNCSQDMYVSACGKIKTVDSTITLLLQIINNILYFYE